MRSTIYYEAKMGFPFNVEAAASFLAARDNGANTAIFEDISEVPLNRANMLVASIEATHKWFKAMGWTIPPSITYPECFNRYNTYIDCVGRRIHKYGLKFALDNCKRPFFMKPYNLKQFPATIIDKHERHSFAEHLSDDTPVYVSDIVDFVSEYRVYVLDRKAVGVCHYNGDIFVFPDQEKIESMIDLYTDSPIFYSLDVGIVDTGETYLIECNDGYSLGNYGLAPKLYHRCLMARWREILNQNPVRL